LLEVDLDRILQSIHEYFEELGMAEIRKRYVMGFQFRTLLIAVFYFVSFMYDLPRSVKDSS
jgi:hypothetical protein